MKLIYILTLMACVVCGLQDAAGAAQPGASTQAPTKATVYYLAFQAEQYAGYLEDNIEIVGCTYTVDRNAFRQIVENATAGSFYNKLNVTAEVVLSPGEKYYIDRHGNLAYHGAIKSIDKDRFAKSLTLVPTKRCHG